MAGRGFFRNEEGEKSSMRIIWAFISITVIATWAIISIYTWKIQPLGYDLSSLLVLLSGSKVAQTMVEKGDLSLKLGEKVDPTTGEPIRKIKELTDKINKLEKQRNITSPKTIEVK